MRTFLKFGIAAGLAAAMLLANSAFAYSKPGNPTGYVNDFAKVLSVDQKNALEQKLDSFDKETSNEIAVVTIKSLDGDTIENYAVKLFQDFKIGKEGRDNGILLLIAVEDRKMRIEVGHGLEGALTDLESGQIINNVLKPAFQQGDYYSGIDQAVDLVIAKTKGEYAPIPGSDNSQSQGSDFQAIFFIVVVGLSFLSSILGRSKSWWAGGLVGGIAGIIIGLIKGFLFFGIISLIVLIPFGLLFDYVVSKKYQQGKRTGVFPWWIGGGPRGGGGFGGFGGGRSGGGGASGGW